MVKKTWNIFFVVVVTVIFALTSYMLYSDAQKQKSLRIKKETELSAKIVELAEIQEQIKRVTAQRNEIESRLNYKVASLEASMKDSDVTIKSQAEKLDALSEESVTLRKDIEDGEKKIAEFARRAQTLEKEKTALTAKLKEFEGNQPEVADEKENDLNSGGGIDWTADMDTVDLGKIVVQKMSGKAALVQHVDSLYGFIVINAGKEDGMTPNMVVNILRNKKMIGRAVVQKTEKNVSAAVVLPRWTRGEIKEGDVVSRF